MLFEMCLNFLYEKCKTGSPQHVKMDKYICNYSVFLYVHVYIAVQVFAVDAGYRQNHWV